MRDSVVSATIYNGEIDLAFIVALMRSPRAKLDVNDKKSSRVTTIQYKSDDRISI